MRATRHDDGPSATVPGFSDLLRLLLLRIRPVDGVTPSQPANAHIADSQPSGAPKNDVEAREAAKRAARAAGRGKM